MYSMSKNENDLPEDVFYILIYDITVAEIEILVNKNKKENIMLLKSVFQVYLEEYIFTGL